MVVEMASMVRKVTAKDTVELQGAGSRAAAALPRRVALPEEGMVKMQDAIRGGGRTASKIMS